MNDRNEVQPPLPQGPPMIPVEMVADPPLVKVFGILHLVFAALGICSSAWALFNVFAGNAFVKMISAPEQLDAQLKMQQQVLPMTLTSGILGLIVAIPMIIAGIQMLRKKRNGLKWSNGYAYASLLEKLIRLIFTLTTILPAMEAMTAGMMPKGSSAQGAEVYMSMIMAVGAIGGVFFSSIYPTLTLVMLNRPKTKEWFARLPD